MDQGHTNLITDLTDLLYEAKAFKFHDFQNSDYDVPKISLIEKLEEVIRRTKEGNYDN